MQFVRIRIPLQLHCSDCSGLTLRVKGTLISEPRFSIPCEMRFFPREERENGLCQGFFFEKAVFPFSRGKNCILQRVENRGSPINMPLALRVGFLFWINDVIIKNRGAFIRAACLQNETAPEKFLNRYEKRFEKREKRSEKRSETRLKKN